MTRPQLPSGRMVNARDRTVLAAGSHIKVISIDLFGLIERAGVGT
jgi:hypothetical protein